mgnify:CR=1 FL=1
MYKRQLFICGVAKADVNYGVSLMFGEVDTSGHELESGSASDKNSKSITESFVGDHYLSRLTMITALQLV